MSSAAGKGANTPRAEVARKLELHYRSATTFLIAYASQLAKGELFLETSRPFALGTRVALELHVEGHGPPIDLSGAVAWTRPTSVGPGQPGGMGIGLSAPIDLLHGERVDHLARRHHPVRCWISCRDEAGRASLTRSVQSLVTCEIVDDEVAGSIEAGAGRGYVDGGGGGGLGEARPPRGADGERRRLDLAIIDLDSWGSARAASIDAALRRLRLGDAHERALPVFILTHLERVRARESLRRAVDEILPNPPGFQGLQAAVMHGLSRPAYWTAREP